jgi:hypothetical protein
MNLSFNSKKLAFEMAYKEARISKKHGGYVMATNVFPFI